MLRGWAPPAAHICTTSAGLSFQRQAPRSVILNRVTSTVLGPSRLALSSQLQARNQPTQRRRWARSPVRPRPMRCSPRQSPPASQGHVATQRDNPTCSWLCGLRRHREIARHPLECLFVTVVILPTSEVHPRSRVRTKRSRPSATACHLSTRWAPAASRTGGFRLGVTPAGSS
jgi:hypothetical protein